ncbi:MAG: hypothetical protein V4592_01965 [Bacteroidota bacterium]
MNEFLVNSIKLLAATSNEQREYLKKSGLFPCTDELALAFDDVYRYLKTQDKDSLSLQIKNKLAEIDTILDVLSNLHDDSNWNEKSLDDSNWTKVRRIAKSLLEEID